jgi:hypothetical protein
MSSWGCGMTTLSKQEIQEVGARGVRFDNDMLVIELSDEREIALPFKKIKWLTWLAKATPEQRANWSIEPYGYAVWWEDLDDGIEVIHALSLQPLPHQNVNLPMHQTVAGT